MRLYCLKTLLHLIVLFKIQDYMEVRRQLYLPLVPYLYADPEYTYIYHHRNIMILYYIHTTYSGTTYFTAALVQQHPSPKFTIIFDGTSQYYIIITIITTGSCNNCNNTPGTYTMISMCVYVYVYVYNTNCVSAYKWESNNG